MNGTSRGECERAVPGRYPGEKQILGRVGARPGRRTARRSAHLRRIPALRCLAPYRRRHPRAGRTGGGGAACSPEVVEEPDEGRAFDPAVAAEGENAGHGSSSSPLFSHLPGDPGWSPPAFVHRQAGPPPEPVRSEGRISRARTGSGSGSGSARLRFHRIGVIS